MTPETLRRFEDGLGPLATARCDLNVLARSLRHVGQDKVAAIVLAASEMINASETVIRDALSEAGAESLRDAEQASANIFRTALAIADLSKQNQ